MEIILKNEQATAKIAQKIAQVIEKGAVIGLVGDLGAGKTAFTRYFTESLCKKSIVVTSPSFTLLNRYECDRLTINHIDLYRLGGYEEFVEAGLEEIIFDSGAVSVIEWFDILESYLIDNSYLLEMVFNTNDTRTMIIDQNKGKNRDLLRKLNLLKEGK